MTIEEVKLAALAGDVPGFVDALMVLAQTDVYWGHQLRAVHDAVELGKLPCRFQAAVALSERLSSIASEDAKCLLDYVIDYLLIEEGRRTDLPDALAILGVAAKYWEFTTYVAMEELGATVLMAGGTLDPEVVAVMRRTATIEGHRSLKEFVAGVKQPLLNRGDAWADRARTEPAAPPTTKPYAPWPTGWSASCTAAYATARPTTRTPPGPPSRKATWPKRLDTLRPRDV